MASWAFVIYKTSAGFKDALYVSPDRELQAGENIDNGISECMELYHYFNSAITKSH